MPPKKAAKGGSKKSKAAARKAELLEQKQREEEERLRLEEEERQRRIEEERRRIEEEEKRQIRLALKREEDKTRLENEREADSALETIIRMRKAGLEHEQTERAEWDKILRCDTLPDVNHEPSLSSYLTLWKDETQTTPDLVIWQCQAAQELLFALDVAIAQARQTFRNDRIAWAIEKMAEIDQISQPSLDRMTATLLTEADRDGAMLNMNMIKQSNSELLKVGVWTTGHIKVKRNKLVEFDEIGVTVDPPNMLTMQNNNGMGLRVIYQAHDRYQQVNQSLFCAYGGVYQIDAVELPLPSFMMHDWVAREINDAFETVQCRQYPNHVVGGDGTTAAIQPVKLSWKIGRQIIVDDLPQVGWWNSQSSSWSTEGITDVKFNSVNRVITLQSLQLKPLALIHPRTSDYPYQTWSIKSLAPSHIRIALEGPRMVVEIEVRDDHCVLIKPQATELAHLTKPMKPAPFLSALERCGICIMPDNLALKQIGRTLKDDELEKTAYEHMARMVTAFEMKLSRWNSQLRSDHCAFQAYVPKVESKQQQQLQPGEAPATEQLEGNRINPDWITIGATTGAFFVSRYTEQVENQTWDYDDPEMPEECRHVSLARTLQSRSTTGQIGRIEQTPIAFQEATIQLLTSLRLLTS